jgi:precorrin-3B synthase
VVVQADGRTALVAVVPLGRLTADQAGLLAGTSTGELQLTPWRSVVVPDLADAGALPLLTAAGIELDPGSPWLRVTACAGRPGCAKSLADVRSDVVRAVTAGELPAGEVMDVLATGEGYRVG